MIGESAQSEPPGGGVQIVGPNFGLGRFDQKLQGPLLNVAQRILGDPIEAEDVTIEVLARLLPRLQEFDSEGHFAAYARASVRNAAVDRARQRSFRDARRALGTPTPSVIGGRTTSTNPPISWRMPCPGQMSSWMPTSSKCEGCRRLPGGRSAPWSPCVTNRTAATLRSVRLSTSPPPLSNATSAPPGCSSLVGPRPEETQP